MSVPCTFQLYHVHSRESKFSSHLIGQEKNSIANTEFFWINATRELDDVTAGAKDYPLILREQSPKAFWM
ncbi:hypothetical protein Vi05172_g4864 [Venturia inaequalis]|nr:hypothetical protein Vi05172_g4864 [Venturia inaequalis]